MPAGGTLQIIAHRGASIKAPENTLSSIRSALTLGVDYVEIDVRLSKDNVPVIIHDASLERTGRLRNSPKIHDLTLAQIKLIDVGSWFGDEYIGEPIPTLEDVIAENWGHTGLMIEIKKCRQNSELVVSSIFNVLAQKEIAIPKIIIGSFSVEIIKEVKKKRHHLPFSFQIIGIAEKKAMIPLLIEQQVKQIAIWHKLITEKLIRMLKSEQIEVWVFTVDDLTFAQMLLSFGAAGIISNDPGRLLDFFVRLR